MKRNQKLLVVRTMMIIVLIFSLFPFSSVLAEQNIGNSSIPDDISDRTLTIWKYQVKDISELGGNGDGLAKTIDKTPLPGIKFSIEKVVAKDGAKLNDPTVDKDYDLVNDSEGNPIRSVVITGDDGSTKHLFGTGKEADGIYLVTELPDDRPGTGPKVVQPVPPFFVNVPMTHRTEKDKLIYDIEVQPKNILESIIEPTKTIEDETAFSNKAGAIFDWEATANVPFGLYQVPAKDAVITPVYDREGNVVADLEVKKDVPYYANYLEFHDTLDAKLVLDDVVLQEGTVSNKNSWTNLEFDVDYTVSVDGTKADDSIGLKGRSLEPMKGISYLIERVTLSDSGTGFKPVTGINSFKAQIVTNESGIAYIDQLNQGMYRITEEKNSKIKGIMDPVILELPLPRPSGLSLTDVFLYPKSSVADGNTQVVKPREDTGKLPQTSGNVGSYESIIWSIAFVFGMGLIAFYMIYRKKEIV